MSEFEAVLNDLLVDTFNYILKFEERSIKSIADTRITVAEAHLIEAISKLDGNVTVGRIANELKVSMPTATISVKKLESKGLVSKLACSEDARRAIIQLTKTGEKINRAHRLFHESMIRSISRKFNEDEKKILIRAMDTINRFFREKIEAQA